MQLDDAPLHQSCERCRGIGAKVGCLPPAFAHVHTRHCLVDGTVRVLLIKTLTAPAVRAAHEAERPTLDVRQQMRRDADVVLREIAFGQSGFRKVRFFRMR